jgi:hypothetical protein
MAGLVWFFLLLLLFELFLAGGQKTHRLDLPIFAALVILGLLIVVAAIRRLAGWLIRSRDRDAA